VSVRLLRETNRAGRLVSQLLEDILSQLSYEVMTMLTTTEEEERVRERQTYNLNL
jgi:hypothetical protein